MTANSDGQSDFVQVFARSKPAVDRQAMTAVQALKAGGLLWFAYPKISSKVKTDITRDTGWEALDGAGIRPVTSRRPEMRMSASRLLILVAVILFVLEAVGVSLGGLVWTCSRWAWRSLLARSLCLSSMSTPPTTDRRAALQLWIAGGSQDSGGKPVTVASQPACCPRNSIKAELPPISQARRVLL